MIPLLIGGALAVYIGKKLLEDDDSGNPREEEDRIALRAEEDRQEAAEAAKRKEVDQELQNFLEKHGLTVSAFKKSIFVNAAKNGENDPNVFDHEYGLSDAMRDLDAKIDMQQTALDVQQVFLQEMETIAKKNTP